MSKKPPLTCLDTTWLVSDARERALTDDELEALETHIATCAPCQSAKVQFEVLFRGLEAMLRAGGEPVPESD